MSTKHSLLAAIVFFLVPVYAEAAGTFELHVVAEVASDRTKEYALTQPDGHSEKVFLDVDVLLDHTALTSATLEHAADGSPTIQIKLTETGGKRLGAITTANLHKRLGMVLNGQLYSAPTVAMPILGKELAISGNFSEAEATKLVEMLNQSIPTVPDDKNGPLTATELARQLHVYSWITKVNLERHEAEVSVLHVVDGRIKTTVLTDGVYPTDREFERIVVLANQTPAGTKVSIQPGSSGAMSMGWEERTDTIPLSLTTGLPDSITEGDYLLGCDSSVEKLNTQGAIKIEDIKEGMVLRLHKKAFGVASRDQLVAQLIAALDSHDRTAFEKCVNFDGVDADVRNAFTEIENQFFALPSHDVFASDRIDKGPAHVTKDGKSYTLNGDWTFLIDIYRSKPPSKGWVLPAGVANGKSQVLLTVAEKQTP